MIVVHHSATLSGSCAHFRVLHRGVFGWDDVGYHFVIGNGTFTPEGRMEEGRPVWAVGAHARDHNLESIGVCLVGNFEETEPGAAQGEALRELLARLTKEHGIGRDGVVLHRDVPGCRTACPGRHLASVFRSFGSDT